MSRISTATPPRRLLAAWVPAARVRSSPAQRSRRRHAPKQYILHEERSCAVEH